MKYVPTIGLEIHAELKTRTKMFCGCANNSDERKQNANVCPICMGHPGTLPTVNKEAVRNVLMVGVALKGNIADFTEWDRKNYFYPDIPKGYQISQYKYPLVSGGLLKGIEITRIHLEEDTGTLIHADISSSVIPAEEGIQKALGPRLHADDKTGYSFVDYNRAGVPLMELVTEPVIHDAKTAGDFARELQLVLRYLGVSDANMEKGEMRVEANISVMKSEIRSTKSEIKNSKQELGTKVEVKNLNSFRAVEKAIDYEIERQILLLEAGEKVVQETRGWDEGKQKTYSQRKKEESHDYRYFPEPDIPKFKLGEIEWAREEVIRKTLPELPEEKRRRYAQVYGIKKEDIEIYVTDFKLGKYFEEVAKTLMLADEGAQINADRNSSSASVRLVSNYITSDIVGHLKSGKSLDKITPESFAKVIVMIEKGELSSRGAKDTLSKLLTEGGEPNSVAKAIGVIQIHDEGEIERVVKKVIAENEKVVADFKGGKVAALQFLVGQVMKETRGAASPNSIKDILTKLLG